MSHHLIILHEDEYQQIQAQRLNERREKQFAAECQYNYSKEKQAELLKQRDLQGELKSLNRRKKGIIVALYILSVACGILCGRMIKAGQVKRAVVAETASIATVVLAGLRWRKYNHKIHLKKEEIACAKRGWICPRLELYRQEGKSHY